MKSKFMTILSMAGLGLAISAPSSALGQDDATARCGPGSRCGELNYVEAIIKLTPTTNRCGVDSRCSRPRPRFRRIQAFLSELKEFNRFTFRSNETNLPKGRLKLSLVKDSSSYFVSRFGSARKIRLDSNKIALVTKRLSVGSPRETHEINLDVDLTMTNRN